ncbi:arginase family protein [Glycomyces luteolus]|uniref:Arginase family protein n=1 Tax=Glycomyces luteolus TaxID=2670330 RepID=A0A9X3SQG6_9ACTN|nr:arginase family protein [Glycomyces luteolus]MDA1360492.1 arginase family protein [Glycomyces luteolus]
MTVLLVPYHLDERLPDDEFPVAADRIVAKDLHGGDFWSRVAGLYDLVGDAVATAKRPTTVVTADCTVALGVVTGLQRLGLEPSVMWFDAHGDLHTPASSASGYPGGMVLRMLLGEGDGTVAETTGLTPIPPERVVLVDARDLDAPEAEYLSHSAVERVPVEAATAPDGPVYLHIDLDVLDADLVPGLRYPVTPGPTPDQIRDAAQRILATGRVAAMTIACTWRPGEGAPAAAKKLVDELLAAARGIAEGADR